MPKVIKVALYYSTKILERISKNNGFGRCFIKVGFRRFIQDWVVFVPLH